MEGGEALSARIEADPATVALDPESRGQGVRAACVLLASATAVLAIRLHRLDLPLERDEGEYAYGAQLILARSFSYASLHTMKLPGTHAIYAFFVALLGPTRQAVHAGLLAADFASMFLLFRLARRFFAPVAAAGAAGTFGILALSTSVLGLYAHAEHFALPFALAGTLLLLRASSGGRRLACFASGFGFGLAFLAKQQTGILAVLGPIWIVAAGSRGPSRAARSALRIALFAAGVAVPWLATCVIFLLGGTFASFWRWTVQYAGAYVSTIPLERGLGGLRAQTADMLSAAPLLWALAGVGLVALAADRRLRSRAPFLALFTLLSLFSTSPGFYFRNHYWVAVLPAAGLLAGAGLDSIERLSRSVTRAALGTWATPLALAIAGGGTLLRERQNFWVRDAAEVSRAIYPTHPFPEMLEIGRTLRARSAESDTIGVLGSEPELLFYAQRRSATAYVYLYPLMEPQPYALEMQQEMLAELQSAAPRFLVHVNHVFSWGLRPTSHRLLTEGARRLGEEHYRLLGIVDLGASPPVCDWDAEAARHPPKSSTYVVISQRKE